MNQKFVNKDGKKLVPMKINQDLTTSGYEDFSGFQTLAEPTTKKGTEINRYVHEENGRKVYEWDQNLEEVNIYINAPPNAEARHLSILIETDRLTVDLESNGQHYINEKTFSKVNKSESSWYLSDGLLHIVLMKQHRGEVWKGVLQGSDVDCLTEETMKSELARERLAEENPGFNFQDAEFNGPSMDPRTDMGGIGYGR